MNSTNKQTLDPATSAGRCGYLTLLAALTVLLAMTTGTALAGTPFAGKMPEMRIADAAQTNAPPTPVLKYTLNGNTVAVDASGSHDADGSVAQYRWDFGDGGKATGVTATHQYDSDGRYSLTLTVVDNAGGVGIAQQQLDLGALFYWSVDSLPQATPILSDIGNVSITRALSKDNAASVPGFKGNCMQQTGNNQYYKIPMTTVPDAKGTIRMYARHETTADPTDATNRYFFISTNNGKANALYAYVYKSTIYFYVYDSAGTYHRTYSAVTWQTGTWYLYEFNWDAATGLLAIKRDGVMLTQATTPNWTAAIPSWAGQDLSLGYVYPLGSLDEIYITH